MAISVLATSAMAACAAAVPETGTDPATIRKVEQIAAKRESQLKTLAEADPEIRERCLISDGDCMIEVRARREKLSTGRSFYKCHTGLELEPSQRCEENVLVDEGHGREVADYYELHTWCIQRVLECVARGQQDAAAAAKQARYKERRQAAESSVGAKAALAAVELAVAKVDFARSTLPASAEDVCTKLADAPACLKQVQDAEAAYEAYLSTPKGEFVAQGAIDRYRKSKQAEVSCQDAELQCLIEAAAEFGGVKQTRSAFDTNLELIAQRQKLLQSQGSAAGQACLQQAVAGHQVRVVEAYRQYSKHPQTYFRLQLQKAFQRMHRDQVECLERQAQ